MIIFPAIDLYNQEVVRLTKGEFDSVKTYENDPVKVAKQFENDGASWLHVIDLNGAEDGTTVNQDVIKEIIKNTNLLLQVGGGIRSVEKIEEYLALGVKRVILGSYAVKNIEGLSELVNRYNERIIVSVDSKNGLVTYSGWQDKSGYETVNFCQQVEDKGIKTIVYTDIDKDGMLEGTDVKTIIRIQESTSLNVIASGGVTSYDDINKLLSNKTYGAIIGKALYENKLNLSEVTNYDKSRET